MHVSIHQAQVRHPGLNLRLIEVAYVSDYRILRGDQPLRAEATGECHRAWYNSGQWDYPSPMLRYSPEFSHA